MILGDDDVLGLNVIELFYKSIKEAEMYSDVIRFASCKIDGLGNKTSNIYRHKKNENSTDFLFNGSRSSLSEYIFNKKQVLKVGFKEFPLAWYSDVLAVLEFSKFKKFFQ